MCSCFPAFARPERRLEPPERRSGRRGLLGTRGVPLTIEAESEEPEHTDRQDEQVDLVRLAHGDGSSSEVERLVAEMPAAGEEVDESVREERRVRG